MMDDALAEQIGSMSNSSRREMKRITTIDVREDRLSVCEWWRLRGSRNLKTSTSTAKKEASEEGGLVRQLHHHARA